jgi:hypothetical protein
VARKKPPSDLTAKQVRVFLASLPKNLPQELVDEFVFSDRLSPLFDSFLRAGFKDGLAFAYKTQKRRRSDAKVIDECLEICDLRNTDKRTWSHEKLARRFGKTRQRIAAILRNELKWRCAKLNGFYDRPPANVSKEALQILAEYCEEYGCC